VEGEGPDGLGRLASTFNSMASRIKELVDNLEQKVQERTLELSESENRFRAIIENTPQGILTILSSCLVASMASLIIFRTNNFLIMVLTSFADKNYNGYKQAQLPWRAK